jgi:hypothetical protein
MTAKNNLRACWWRRARADKWRYGDFHAWGFEAPSETVMLSVAIVEDCETHAIVSVEPTNVHFGSDPTMEPARSRPEALRSGTK